MDNAICMEKCEGHCDVVTDVDLNVVRDLLSGCFQKVSQTSSMSSIKRTGRPVSGSVYIPRYCMTLGCLIVFRN